MDRGDSTRPAMAMENTRQVGEDGARFKAGDGSSACYLKKRARAVGACLPWVISTQTKRKRK